MPVITTDQFISYVDRDAQILVRDHLIATILSAEQTIDVCLYDIALDAEGFRGILDALECASQNNVVVRFLLDSTTKSGNPGDETDLDSRESTDDTTTERLARITSNIVYRSYPINVSYRGIMHNKFILIDAASPDAMIWTGSSNLTTTSLGMHRNDFILFRGNEIAAVFLDEFENLYQGQKWRGSVSLTPRTINQRFNSGDGLIIIPTFSQVNDPVSYIVDALNRSVNQIRIMMFTFTSKYLMNLLRDLKDDGRDIEVILSAGQILNRDAFADDVDLSGISLADFNRQYANPTTGSVYGILRTAGIPARIWPGREVLRGTLTNIISGEVEPGPNPETYGNTISMTEAEKELERIRRKMVLHNKLCIVDDYLTLFGSFNWTESASRYNDETLLILEETGSKPFATAKLTEFVNVWNESEELF